jgi:hypothetical protein
MKLIKRDDNFYSLKLDGIVMATSNGMLVDYNLSKQNCDELFGVVDVEKLANELYPYHFKTPKRIAYKQGFSKAMELNDKLFTLEQLIEAMNLYRKNLWTMTDVLEKMQPTEINVEIEMEDFIGIGDKYTPELQPKLDSSGNLILKKTAEEYYNNTFKSE